MTQQLIDLVIEQIKQDVANEDYTAIEELLQLVDPQRLEAFLSESVSYGEDDGQPTEHDEWMSFDPDC